MEDAKEEIDSLRTELSQAQQLNADLQSLLEVDQESHPSNKKVTALQAQLATAQNELEASRHSLALKANELAKKTELYDTLKSRVMVQNAI